ncbi:MAG: hypothetical protein Q9169_008754, partial [Polycauliona sp. 2 TL-2023]
IADAEGNAKRVMLIGTALLSTVDLLISVNLFHPSSSLRNIGSIIALLLEFAVSYEETCDNNEDGWRLVVVRKMDLYGIKVHGLKQGGGYMNDLRHLAEEEDEEEAAAAEDWVSGNGDAAVFESEFPNCVNAYKPETGPESEVRIWEEWDWKAE